MNYSIQTENTFTSPHFHEIQFHAHRPILSFSRLDGDGKNGRQRGIAKTQRSPPMPGATRSMTSESIYSSNLQNMQKSGQIRSKKIGKDGKSECVFCDRFGGLRKLHVHTIVEHQHFPWTGDLQTERIFLLTKVRCQSSFQNKEMNSSFFGVSLFTSHFCGRVNPQKAVPETSLPKFCLLIDGPMEGCISAVRSV